MNKPVRDLILDNGYEDVLIFENPDYTEAFIGISDDNRAIYDFELMVKSLCDNWDITDIDAIEFIEVNTLRSLEYYENSPIILYRLI